MVSWKKHKSPFNGRKIPLKTWKTKMNKVHDIFFKARIGKDYNNPTEKWFIRDLQLWTWRFHVKTQWRFQNNLRKDHLIWEYCTAIQIFLIIVRSFYNICFICSDSCSLPIKSGIKSKISRETIDIPSAVDRKYRYELAQSKSSYLDELPIPSQQ